MIVSCCTCNCGNIHIEGQLMPQLHHQFTEKGGHKFCKTFFYLKSHSLNFQNSRDGKKHTLSKSSSNVRCLVCGTSFRAISCDQKLYLEKSQPFKNSNKLCQKYFQNNQMNNLLKNNNVLVVPFSILLKQIPCKQITNECADANNKFNENDTDFELMFSNKYDPFVGSYEHYNENYC